ncbi:hypothetical protein SEUCBS140593_005925 [Sporothrix eucalyptigena]|uniref:Mid2 domain-containing protein n=1 Tax=Sporothrix eucalyptigena TaxID=1812306 RepID=A0ABP0C0V3_9PEZI
MTKLPLRAAWLLIAAAFWTSRTANALSIPVNALSLFERAATASSSCSAGFDQCTGFNFPSDFCCSSGSVCNALAGNTTLLCCPEGQSCESINPITCDISAQNAELHPEAPIKTTALNGVLTKCGSSCCPFGYNCNGNNLCILENNQNAAPLQNVPTTTASTTTATTSSTSAKTTSTQTAAAQTTAVQSSGAQSVTVAVATTQATATNGASPTSSRTGTDSNESAVASADDKSNGGKSTASIVGGVIGGLAGLLLIGAAFWFLCGRRLRRGGAGSGGSINSGNGGGRLGSGMRQRDPMNFLSDTNKPTRSTSSFGNIINNPLSISSPKPQGDATAFRTDFIRKLPSSHETSRPTTPASSTIGTIGLNGRQPASVASPLSLNLDRNLPAPPSPSPPPLILQRPRDSMSVAPIRGMRSSPPRQHQPREPSMEEINIGADPSIMGFGGNFTISPPGTLLPPSRAAAATTALASVTSNTGSSQTGNRDRSNDRMTTFSSLLQAADIDPERPFVLNSVQSSPAPRRR